MSGNVVKRFSNASVSEVKTPDTVDAAAELMFSTASGLYQRMTQANTSELLSRKVSVVTFEAADTTPSVATGVTFQTANATDTITAFDDAVAGRVFTVFCRDNDGISGSGTLILDAAAGNYVAQAGGAMFQFVAIGANVYEVSRTVF